MNNQAKVIFTSFIYFSIVIEKNNWEISKELIRLYSKLKFLTKMYYKHLDTVVKEASAVIEKLDKDVDFLLLSVTILAEYYEQLRGKKKHFNPMSHKEILLLQDECLELDDSTAEDTFYVAEKLVKELLK